jgi:membrane protein DedA with SNARE-associated domain
VAVIFVLCGLGLPLPEELVLLAGGYYCAQKLETASLPLMMVWCAGGILAGDVLPYVLGRVFGVRLLRLRWLRLVVTKQRLASFDRWFRRRGDLVILIARFIPGLRVVAFFTAGTMKMAWRRFLFLDGLGIALMVPLLTWLGFHSAPVIDDVAATVRKLERGLLWTVVAGTVVLAISLWWWRRRRRQRQPRPAEAFIQPQLPVQPVQQPAPQPPAPQPAVQPLPAADPEPAARTPATEPPVGDRPEPHS